MLRVLELFGGIGACSKALERLEIPYEIADYVEIDKYAVKSFNAIHGTNFEPQDITEWNKDIQVDLIMHGSPCQDFSLAGKQEGGDEGSGTRSSLMYETIRIVDKLRPKYVIWENVKNVISKKHKHNWDKYVQRMKELGYTSYGKVMNAKNYGIPQNRERVFTISIREDLNQEFAFPEPKPLQKKLKDMLEENVDEKYYLSDKMLNCFMSDGTGKYPRRERFLQNINKENKDVANTIITTEGNKPTCNFVKDTENYIEWEDGKNIQMNCRAWKEDKTVGTINTSAPAKILIKNATKKGYLEAEEGDGVDISSRMEYHRENVQKGIIQTLDCTGGNGHGVVVKNMKQELCDELIRDGKVQENDMIRHSYTTWRKEKEFHTENSRNNNISATLTTRPDTLGVAVNEPPLRIRKLTPKECWRLMGFDDEDFDKAEKVNSNAQLYKQAGNSIVVNVLEGILKELIKENE